MILTTIIRDPVERSRFVKFAIVGAVGAAVDFGIFNLLTEIVHLQPIPSSVLSFMAAVTSNFTWNRLWTYPDSRTKSLWRQLTEFTIVNVIGLGIRTPVFAISGKLLFGLLEDSTSRRRDSRIRDGRLPVRVGFLLVRFATGRRATALPRVAGPTTIAQRIAGVVALRRPRTELGVLFQVDDQAGLPRRIQRGKRATTRGRSIRQRMGSASGVGGRRLYQRKRRPLRPDDAIALRTNPRSASSAVRSRRRNEVLSQRRDDRGDWAAAVAGRQRGTRCKRPDSLQLAIPC